MEAAYRPRVLSEIDPHSEWVQGDDFDTLIVDVSGFTKEQLKVQVEPSGSLKISGERAINGGRQWLYFFKRFDLPGNCDAAMIRVQLDKGVLYVKVPSPSAAAGSSSDEHPAERYEDALQEEEAGAVWRRHWAARSLSRHWHWHAVLNVVLAVVLLWLEAFGKNKPSGGHIKNE